MPDNRIAWGQICDIADDFNAIARNDRAAAIARFIRALEDQSTGGTGAIRRARRAAGLRIYTESK